MQSFFLEEKKKNTPGDFHHGPETALKSNAEKLWRKWSVGSADRRINWMKRRIPQSLSTLLPMNRVKRLIHQGDE